MNVAACYLSYLAISIGLTVWVARTLHRSGRVFLVDAFHGNAELADSVNHLLVVGFYLINVGYIALALKTNSPMATLRQIIELESVKIGVVLLILGGMHFSTFWCLRRCGAEGRRARCLRRGLRCSFRGLLGGFGRWVCSIGTMMSTSAAEAVPLNKAVGRPGS